MKKYAPFKNINLKNVVKFFYTDLYLPASNNSNITFVVDCIASGTRYTKGPLHVKARSSGWLAVEDREVDAKLFCRLLVGLERALAGIKMLDGHVSGLGLAFQDLYGHLTR